MRKSSKVRIFNINGIKHSVKLTNVNYNEAMSDETNCFSATLQVKTPSKTYSLDCSNRGCGGETNINRWGENKEIFETLNGYLKTKPNVGFISLMKELYNTDVEEGSYGYYMDVESLVDQLLEECIY